MKNPIEKRRGIIWGSTELLDDLINFHYDRILEIFHNAKIVILSMTHDPIEKKFEIGCISPYFKELKDDESAVIYKFQLTKITFGDNPLECRFGFRMLVSSTDEIIFEGK